MITKNCIPGCDGSSDSTPMLSVCAAVYGVDEYIGQCARSLFGQTLKSDVEFIFVDDATPDRSMEILEEVLEEHPDRKPQVRIIRHEHNLGITAARRSAVAAARGRYIIFCDPDDWVDAGLYGELCDAARKTGADCICCDYISEYPNGSCITRRLEETDSVTEMLHSILSGTARGVLWNKLFRREILQTSSVSCPDSIWLNEYVHKVIQMIGLCGKIAFCHGSCYHYRWRRGSILNSEVNPERTHQLIMEIDAMVKLLPDPEFAEDWNFRKRWQLLWILIHSVLPVSEYRALWPEAKRGVWKDLRFPLPKRLILQLSNLLYPLVCLLKPNFAEQS